MQLQLVGAKLWGTLVVGLLFMGASFGVGFALGSHGQQGVVAVVNGQQISKEQLYQTLIKRPEGRQTLQQMINNTLIDQAAARRGIKITEADVQAVVDRVTAQLGGQAQLTQALVQYGMTLDQFREQARVQAILDKILGPEVKITDAQVTDYFNKNQAQFGQPAQAKLAQVVVKTEADAQKVEQALKGGKSFGDVVDQYSIDPNAKTTHGELGWVSQGDSRLDPAADQAIFATAKGRWTQPVQTQDGYVIYSVEDTKAEVKAQLDDATKAKIRQDLTDQAVQQKAGPFVQDLQKKAKIQNLLDPTSQSSQSPSNG